MSRELEVAVAAAEAAGEVLRYGFGRQHRIEYKGEADLVTEADEEAERKIEEVLHEAFPNHGMLTEESEETEGQGDARWIVDPLDGTTNYAHGVPFFCTSIALARLVPPSTANAWRCQVPMDRRVRSWERASPTVPRSWRRASMCSAG